MDGMCWNNLQTPLINSNTPSLVVDSFSCKCSSLRYLFLANRWLKNCRKMVQTFWISELSAIELVNSLSLFEIIYFIIQIFSLAHDWPKHITWPNIPHLKPGNVLGYSSIFKTVRVVRNVWRIINTIASILGKNILKYLSLDIICSSKLTVFGKLFTSRNRYCPQTNIPAYFNFQAKLRLLFVYPIRDE